MRNILNYTAPSYTKLTASDQQTNENAISL